MQNYLLFFPLLFGLFLFFLPLVFKFLKTRKIVSLVSSKEHDIHYLGLLRYIRRVQENPFYDLDKDEENYDCYLRDLVKEVLSMTREFGTPMSKVLVRIKKGVYREYQFKKKLVKQIRGQLTQFVLMLLLTWVFGVILCFELKIIPPFHFILLGIFYQSFGPIIYFWRLNKGINNFSKIFSCMHRILESIQAFLMIEMPMGAILEKANLEEFYELEVEEMAFIQSHLRSLLDQWRMEGVQIGDDLASLAEEGNYLKEMQYEHFLEKMQMLSLFLLALFCLLPYLFLIFALILGELIKF